MDEEKVRYMVFRIYTKEERKDPDDRAVFYGWSYDKAVVKAFFVQRNKAKYKVVKMNEKDIADNFHEDVVDGSTQIDYIKLRSAKTDEEYIIFLTSNELVEREIEIQRLFSDLSSLEDKTLLNMFLNLKPQYLEALYYIGYRPPEIDVLFPSDDEKDDWCNENHAEYQIIETAEDSYSSNENGYRIINHKPYGAIALEDAFRKVIYSVESFIKVLKNDM